MTNWRPSSGPDAASRRAMMLRRLREYFESADILEVDTPALDFAAVSDVHIESLEVSSSLSHENLYLHTSPEFCMKRLLASGYPDIYSIAKVFRDGEFGPNHQPEFTMIEWYRLGFNLDDIVKDALQAVEVALGVTGLAGSARVINYRDAFRESCGVDPINAAISEMADAAGADDDLRKSLGAERNDWLDLLLTTKVAPTFGADELTVLQHYPAPQSALARLCPDDMEVADRFEIFMGTTELANGYVELTDSAIQAERISIDQAARKKRGLALRPVDQSLLDALSSGLPACAGVAMGLERLQMKHDKTDDMRNVITFAFEAAND